VESQGNVTLHLTCVTVYFVVNYRHIFYKQSLFLEFNVRWTRSNICRWPKLFDWQKIQQFTVMGECRALLGRGSGGRGRLWLMDIYMPSTSQMSLSIRTGMGF